MAQASIVLMIEPDLINDAIDSVKRIQDRLAKRHGDAFRKLERQLGRIMSGETPLSLPRLIHLGAETFTVVPPPELIALIKAARELGVI